MTLKKIWPFLFRGDFSIFPKEQLEQRWNEMSSCIKQESSTLKGICYSIFMHNSSLHSVSGAIEVERMSNYFLIASHYNAMGWNYLLKISFTTIRGISAPKILIAPQDGSMLKIRMHLKKEFVCIVLNCTKVFTRFFLYFSLDLKNTKKLSSVFTPWTQNGVENKNCILFHYFVLKPYFPTTSWYLWNDLLLFTLLMRYLWKVKDQEVILYKKVSVR